MRIHSDKESNARDQERGMSGMLNYDCCDVGLIYKWIAHTIYTIVLPFRMMFEDVCYYECKVHGIQSCSE